MANWDQLHIGQLTYATHWPTKASYSLAYLTQLLIVLLTSAVHWPTYMCCSLANKYQLLIGHLVSATYWPTDVSCSDMAKWSCIYIWQRYTCVQLCPLNPLWVMSAMLRWLCYNTETPFERKNLRSCMNDICHFQQIHPMNAKYSET